MAPPPGVPRSDGSLTNEVAVPKVAEPGAADYHMPLNHMDEVLLFSPRVLRFILVPTTIEADEAGPEDFQQSSLSEHQLDLVDLPVSEASEPSDDSLAMPVQQTSTAVEEERLSEEDADLFGARVSAFGAAHLSDEEEVEEDDEDKENGVAVQAGEAELGAAAHLLALKKLLDEEISVVDATVVGDTCKEAEANARLCLSPVDINFPTLAGSDSSPVDLDVTFPRPKRYSLEALAVTPSPGYGAESIPMAPQPQSLLTLEQQSQYYQNQSFPADMPAVPAHATCSAEPSEMDDWERDFLRRAALDEGNRTVGDNDLAKESKDSQKTEHMVRKSIDLPLRPKAKEWGPRVRQKKRASEFERALAEAGLSARGDPTATSQRLHSAGGTLSTAPALMTSTRPSSVSKTAKASPSKPKPYRTLNLESEQTWGSFGAAALWVLGVDVCDL